MAHIKRWPEITMARLFTYIIPVDDGAAPNPYWGVCTLNICKPAIRRAAREGDWVAAFGSKNSPSAGLVGTLVYAMRVTSKLSMRDYDEFASSCCPKKIPDVRSKDIRERLGDAIYDFSSSPTGQRQGVHESWNVKTDLSGDNCLLSTDFVYFGKYAISVPDDLRAIIYQGRGHRSTKNDSFVPAFEAWIRMLIDGGPQLRGEPDYEIDWRVGCTSNCLARKDDCCGEEE